MKDKNTVPETSVPPLSPMIELTKQIDYNPEKFASKVLFKGDGYNLILFALLKDQAIPAHKTPHNAYLQCLRGRADVIIGEGTHTLEKGRMILLPQNIMHSIKALKKTKLMLLK